MKKQFISLFATICVCLSWIISGVPGMGLQGDAEYCSVHPRYSSDSFDA